jgi:hypothetical protein
MILRFCFATPKIRSKSPNGFEIAEIVALFRQRLIYTRGTCDANIADRGLMFSRGADLEPLINRMRGLLALLVALSHAAAVCTLVPTATDYFQSALTPFLMFSGFNYVLGFIVINGYCIARSTIPQPFGLTLQLPTCSEKRALSGGLVSSAAERPCDDVCGLDSLSGEPDRDAADFLDRPTDQ